MAECLDETFAGLRIERTHLGRRSLGGFVALCTAADRLDRASWLALLALGISTLQLPRFMLWCVPVVVGSLAPAPVRRWLGRPRRRTDRADRPADQFAG